MYFLRGMHILCVRSGKADLLNTMSTLSAPNVDDKQFWVEWRVSRLMIAPASIKILAHSRWPACAASCKADMPACRFRRTKRGKCGARFGFGSSESGSSGKSWFGFIGACSIASKEAVSPDTHVQIKSDKKNRHMVHSLQGMDWKLNNV